MASFRRMIATRKRKITAEITMARITRSGGCFFSDRGGLVGFVGPAGGMLGLKMVMVGD